MIDDLDLLHGIRRSQFAADESKLAAFMIQSNAIEGDDGLHPGDIAGARRFLLRPLSAKSLLECHAKLAEHLRVDWAGRYRDCGVRVGDYLAPPHEEVPGLMRAFFKALPDLDSWEAHNRFQKIHPFRDLNGRTGRLIWLHKALAEGYTGRISFLHAYYYATLRHTPDLQPAKRPC